MADYTLYDLTVSLLTPLHVGNGVELLHEYDYAIHKGKTWRINEMKLLDAQNVEDSRLAKQLARTKPTQLLNPSDFDPGSEFFRYVLDGTPRSSGEGAQLREQIKDSYDRPYLPGSGLKGALRTAIAWHGWGVRRMRPDIRQVGRRRQWAGQEYEHTLLGRNPNHDLLRALQVSDSQPVSTNELMVLNVRVLNRVGNLSGAPVEMEALRPDTKFSLSLKLDRVLFSDWARRGGLQLEGREWLEQLSAVVNQHSQGHARSEAKWFSQMKGADRIAGFYNQLAAAKLPANRFIVQLGWGTGWDDKTFGSRLQADSQFMERLISDHRLARGRREQGDPFPKSRRVAVGFRAGPGNQTEEIAATPLGWALVEMRVRSN
ncbi:MAG: type III-A CRISPR-associated RAMP protein Csm5 [Caldilineales bacterium]|nr:type III-A CRISPR-associated RAMP protein Csm5 [Caldilineales bacterium]